MAGVQGTIVVPGSAAFAGFYYPEVLQELLLFLRQNREELGLTDENAFEVHIQLARAFAYVAHLNNTRLDAVATELLLPTARLLESARRLLRLIGRKLRSASPALVTILAKLSAATTADLTDFVPELAEFQTESVPPIGFEVLEAQDLDRTDEVSYAFGLEEEKSGAASVATGSPDIIQRTSGDSFAAADVTKHVVIPKGLSENGGEFRITEFIDADHVRVVRVPGGRSPGFQDETGLAWSLKAFTANGATDVNSAGPTFTPWVSPTIGDLAFFGHPHMLWAQMDFVVDTPAADIFGVFEYFDNRRSNFAPVSVVDNLDGTLTFGLNSLLGASDRRNAEIIVTYLPTGAKERLSSFYIGGNFATSQTYFGQVSPSTVLTDYSITADWVPLPSQVDGTGGFAQSGTITYEFPQDQDRSWLKTEVDQNEGYFVRYRISNVSGGPTSPIIDEVDLDGSDQYMVFAATQGETIGPQTVGSSDGTADQTFELPETPFLDDTELIEVDEGGAGSYTPWARVESFLNSQETSRHYTIESDAQGKATVMFGDGEFGKIPSAGTDNVRATYRVGGDIDGNVGVNTVTINADGVQGISEVTNPRSATGWRVKEGGTEASLERLKRDKPAELRTRNQGVNEGDVEQLAVNVFTSSQGIKPVARAFAIEEGLGVKTIKLLVVGTGGATLTSDEREELDEFFNGNREASPPVSGRAVSNHQVTSFNYEPRAVSVQATVVWPGGNAEAVRNRLLALLAPLAVEDDGFTYVWDFKGLVSLSRIYHEIHAVDPNVENVSLLLLNGSAASVQLGDNELPSSAAANLQITIAES